MDKTTFNTCKRAAINKLQVDVDAKHNKCKALADIIVEQDFSLDPHISNEILDKYKELVFSELMDCDQYFVEQAKKYNYGD